ncbi:MAG: hypothetical protein L6Q54_09845 [Leptospiraceae bacterium]|nr:hypothetical protein [Leptospiraceae bacterium]MCK6381528.1 hypothetical protein [Leptospiraceae bacterium]NUM40667.1 hypothetical protein [Leptospiraceae bacterium]
MDLNESDPVNSLIGRYKAERGVIKSFFAKIPLYSQALENFQYDNADLTIRKEISTKLQSYKNPIRDIEAQFVRKNLLNLIGKTDSLSSLLDRVAISVNSASYGLSGAGTGLKPTQEELEKLAQFDYTVLKSVNDLEDKINEYSSNVSQMTNETDITYQTSLIIKEIEAIDKLFKERKNIFIKL